MNANSDTGRVLLVDDEPAFQRLGGQFLRDLGHEVAIAGDGEQAINVFATGKQEVVLLDLSMPPSMDPEAGLDLIAAFTPMPVIVMDGPWRPRAGPARHGPRRLGFPGQADRARDAALRRRTGAAQVAAGS